jgi:hypothetical protein
MSDDRRPDQSKFDRSASTGPLRPAAAPPPIPPPPGPVLPPGPVPQSGPAAAPQPQPVIPAAQPIVHAASPQPIVEAIRPQPSIPVAVPGDDAGEDSDFEEDDMAPSMIERVRRLQPAPVVLTAGSLGSLAFLLMSVTSHTTPLGVLLSAAVVTGLIFGADAIVASRATWRASQGGETGTAFLLAFIGGISSLISLGALAGTLVMVLVINS